MDIWQLIASAFLAMTCKMCALALTMRRAFLVRAAVAAVVLPGTFAPGAERQMEHLTRGVVAVHQGEGNVYVGWRMLGMDPDGIAFNLYRSTGDEAPVRLNSGPITTSTNFADSRVDVT